MQIHDIAVILFILFYHVLVFLSNIKILLQITYLVKNHIKYYMAIFSNSSYIDKGNEY